MLWLGTGGVLKHTDDLSAFMSFVRSHGEIVATHTGVVDVQPDDCAACQWSQTPNGVSPSIPVIAAVATWRIDISPRLPDSVRTSPVPHAQLRAPPTSV